VVLRFPPLYPKSGTSALETALTKSLTELESVTAEMDSTSARVANYQFIISMAKCLSKAEEFKTCVAAHLMKVQTDSRQSAWAHATRDEVSFETEAAVNDFHNALAKLETFTLSAGALIQIKERVIKGLRGALATKITDSPDDGMSPSFPSPWYRFLLLLSDKTTRVSTVKGIGSGKHVVTVAMAVSGLVAQWQMVNADPTLLESHDDCEKLLFASQDFSKQSSTAASDDFKKKTRSGSCQLSRI